MSLTTKNTDKVQRMYAAVSAALETISTMFKPGIKLSFIARSPGNPEGDVLIGDDNDAAEMIALVSRRLEFKPANPPAIPSGLAKLLRQLRDEGMLSEGQITQALGVDRLTCREILDEMPGATTFDFHVHLARQAAWSEKTFGPGARTKGVCDHIRKELLEIEADPSDLREWIDVVILGLDGAWRCGGTPEQIIAGIVAKQTKNEGRYWPDWRTADPDKAIEHDRSGEPASAHASQAAASEAKPEGCTLIGMDFSTDYIAEVRDAALGEAAQVCVDLYEANIGGASCTVAAERIRALRTNPATPASKGDA